MFETPDVTTDVKDKMTTTRQTTQWAFLSDRKFGPHLLSMLELFEANFEGPRHSDAACDENLDPTGSDLERYDSSRCQHDP